MARLSRIVIPNQPLHIMHRGNNRQDLFETDEDMARIVADLTCALEKSNCLLHAYVIMTNHLHILVTPKDKTDLGTFMQTMANRYVRYFNASRSRTGTIWEGRFKSCLVGSEHYLFALYRYIEMNPVQAGMVEKQADHPWSSYHHNALGKTDKLITEHPHYTSLAIEPDKRIIQYQKLFEQHNTSEQNEQIERATMKGEVYGSDKFHQKISGLIARTTRLTAHGGDRKSKEYKNQAG